MIYIRMQTLARFESHINHRIYRDPSTCDCATCRDVEENWLVIFDENHAYHLYTVQCDYFAEDSILNYRDKK